MWRLQADWHHVRRAPTVERIRVLQSELGEAAALLEHGEQLWHRERSDLEVIHASIGDTLSAIDRMLVEVVE